MRLLICRWCCCWPTVPQIYIEELLNYLQLQGLDPHDAGTLQRLDLPSNLHSLILSRIDQLTEQQKNTIKVASVIGRLFNVSWLWGVYPELGEQEAIKADLNVLSHLDLTLEDRQALWSRSRRLGTRSTPG